MPKNQLDNLPTSLSISELKRFHKAMQEKYRCALNNKEKANASITLNMLNSEFEKRGYDVEKLFKGYKK